MWAVEKGLAFLTINYSRQWILCALLSLLMIPLAALPSYGAADREHVGTGDAFFAKRADGHQGDRASVVPIQNALASYLKAYEQGDGSAELAARILKASYYYATYAETDKSKQKHALQKAIHIGEDVLKKYPDDVALNYQMGGCWGRWGEVNGIIASARKGVAQKVRDFAEKTVQLNPRYAQAGGYRTLGRLHFKAPRIPLVLSWPDKEKALDYLKKAVDLGPENLTNHLFYAESLYHAGAYDQALKEVDQILDTKADPMKVVEDLRDKAEAQSLKQKIVAEYAKQ